MKTERLWQFQRNAVLRYGNRSLDKVFDKVYCAVVRTEGSLLPGREVFGRW